MKQQQSQRQRQKNTLLMRLALWTTIVSLFSVMLVGIISYLNLESEIQENARYYYQQRFDYTCKLIEQQVFAPVVALQQEVVVLSDWDEDMRMLSTTLVTQNAITEMKTLLAQKMQVNSVIADIAVYSSNNNFVISGRSGVRFLNNIAIDTPFDREWIRQLDSLTVSSRLRWLTQRAYPEKLGVEGDVISLVYYDNYGNRDTQKMFLCLSIPCRELLKRVELEDNEALFMVDAQGRTAVGSEELPQSLSGKTGLHRQGDRVYLIGNSQNTPWRYVLSVPVSAYNRHGNVLRSRMLLVSGVIFLIMTAVSFVVINRLTSPFSALLERARALRAEKYDRKRDDMRFVADTFDEYVDYAEAAQRQLDERLEMLRHSFLLSLLLGRSMPEQEMVSYRKLLKLDRPHRIYQAIVMKRTSGSFSPQEEQRFEGMLTEHECEQARFFSAGAYGDLMYAVANAESVEDTRAQLRKMLEALCSIDGTPLIRVLVGGAVDDLECVSESMREIQETLDDRTDCELSLNSEKREAGAAEDSADEHGSCAQAAAQYLHEHYGEDIAVQSIADALNVSRSHLSRVFKEAHGMTILEYLMGVRLSNAMRLLDETNLSVIEISEMTGFNNSNYFFKKFKEKFGLTPMQYRSEEK